MTETMPASSPVLSRPLLLGIALSLALHLAVLIGPQVDLQPLPELTRLDVTLVRTAPQIAVSESPPPAPPPVKKKPRPPAEPKTAQATITDKPVEQPEPVPAPEPAPDPVAAAEPPPVPEPEPAPEPLAEAAPEAVPDAATPPPAPSAAEELALPAEATPAAGNGGQAWPRAGRISYLALMGEKQIPMGKATHQWEVADDGSYRISELVEPTTVAAIPWFRPGRKLRESTGRITEVGLRPERFTEREDGRPGEVIAELDRTTSEFRSAGTTDALPDNAQDILSLLYQLGYPGAAAGGSLPVTTGGALRSFQLETIGEETVHLPFGQGWRARHVRARYGSAREMTDVWLATEHFGLPILIRTIDPKGVIYYLVATEVMVSREAHPTAAR